MKKIISLSFIFLTIVVVAKTCQAELPLQITPSINLFRLAFESNQLVSDSLIELDRQIEINRKLVGRYDDSITSDRRGRSLAGLGIGVGIVVTVVGLVMAEVAAQESAMEKSAQSGHAETSIEPNILGIFIGIPLTIFSSYQFAKLGGHISTLEWKKRKLMLSSIGKRVELTLHF